MPDGLRVLGFDTSGGWCGAALFDGRDVVAAEYVDMEKGQAECLMPMLGAVLAEAGCDWSDLSAIGVGIGPGNFTGVRISVAAARGLALALDIPAVGVSLLDAVAFARAEPVLACLTARRGQVCLQMFGHGLVPDRGPEIADLEALPTDIAVPGALAIGTAAQAVAARLGLPCAPAIYAPASAIARIAAREFGPETPRPAPLYLRPADAAPPREAPPVILS